MRQAGFDMGWRSLRLANISEMEAIYAVIAIIFLVSWLSWSEVHGHLRAKAVEAMAKFLSC